MLASVPISNPTSAMLRSFHLVALLLLAAAAAAPVRAQVVRVDGIPEASVYGLEARGDTLLAGVGDRVYVSTDRGRTWAATAPVADAVTSVDAIAATDAGWFVSSFNRGVFVSRDRGATWAPISTGLDGLGARIVTDFEVYGGQLFAATDGAGVFVLDLAAPTAWRRDGRAFADNEAETVSSLTRLGDILFAGAGGNGLVFVRPPAGPWAPVQLSGTIVDVTTMGRAVVATSVRRAFVSRDAGATWTPTPPLPYSGFYAALAVPDPARADTALYLALTVGEYVSELFRWDGEGAAWASLGLVSETFRMRVYDGRLYLAQVDGLGVLPLPRDTGVVAPPVAGDLSIAVPAPHPVVGTATLTYRVPRSGPVRLEVFDLLGRRTAVLADRPAAAGPASVRWSAAGWAPGLYVARLTTPGGTATRPFVVGQ